MNIPQHTIDTGARALFERDCKDYLNAGGTVMPHPWEQQSPADQLVYRKRASAVLRATSKRIWESGYAAGKEDTFLRAFGHKPIPNPYRSVDE